MPRISLRGFAEVCAAAQAKKTSTLKRYKFSQSDESKGRSNYYVKALSAIKLHHRGNSNAVQAAVKKLRQESLSEPDSRRRAKAGNNLRAIQEYLLHFGHRKIDIKPAKRLYFVRQDLIVSSQPDLVGEENGRLILIKLNLGKKPFAGGVNLMLLHMLYEAAKAKGLDIEPRSVESLQVCDGSWIRGPKDGFGSIGSLNRGCDEILSLWPSIS